jgi:hypothetical protein
MCFTLELIRSYLLKRVANFYPLRIAPIHDLRIKYIILTFGTLGTIQAQTLQQKVSFSRVANPGFLQLDYLRF